MNELTTTNNNSLIADFSDTQVNTWTSLKAETYEDKAKLYNTMSNPTGKISDLINTEINIVDLFVEMVDITDDTTGEIITTPRTVIITDMGDSYQAVSRGIYSSLKKIISVFGPPTWSPALTVKVVQVELPQGRTFNFRVV